MSAKGKRFTPYCFLNIIIFKFKTGLKIVKIILLQVTLLPDKSILKTKETMYLNAMTQKLQ